MNKDKIVTNQRITGAKRQRARELRQDMTPAERRLWGELRANRLGGWHFRRQQIIDGFIVDFYCHKTGLVIEVDGPIHDTQQVLDAEREEAFQKRGLMVMRFTNRQVMNDTPLVLKQIREKLTAIQFSAQPLPNTAVDAESDDTRFPFPSGKGLGDGS
ncbi:MAG: endonuclease domain-containing protein [Anaerolineales bacterium]|nr:endonuclease domain-containing protein [Anaerolineales bacterium]